MSQVSRPMQIALLATVLIAIVWFVALRPKPASVGAGAAAPSTPAQQAPSAPGTTGLATAVDKAHGAVDTASADAQRAASSSGAAATPSGASAGTSGAGSTAAAKDSTTAGTAKAHATGGAHHAHRVADPNVRMIRSALRRHKAIAIAFVNPKISDARAVSEELRHVSNLGGRAVTLSVPIAQLSRYGFITREVDVTVAPTTIVIGPQRHATTIVGFADRFEIEQRLADTLR